MKIRHSWLVLVILAALVIVYGVASADNPLTYDVYVHGQYTCFDFGEWGQCLCPCDEGISECATLYQPPGIGGGPAVDDWIEVTPITTLTSVPIPINHPKGEPTNTPPPTFVVPTRERPPIVPTSTPTPDSQPVPTNTPIPATVTPKPTATDRPTSVPPTATARSTIPPTIPTLVPTIQPTIPPWDGGCVCHKGPDGKGHGKPQTKCFGAHQKAAYDAHIRHGDTPGPCP